MEYKNKLDAFAVELFNIGAVKFGSYKLKTGIMSPIYIDLRVVIAYPKLMRTLCQLLQDLMVKENVTCDQICGVPYTALPIASVISVETGTPMVIRRKEAKDYGTKKLIEGVFKPGDSCVIIEDIISSGSSVLETVKGLENEGLTAKTAIVVLNREQGGMANLSAAGITVHTLFSISQLLKILEEKGLITSQVFKSVQTFLAESQINTDGSIKSKISEPVNERLKMSLSERAALTKNAVTKRLLSVMEEKKSLLAVAADVTSSEQLLDVARAVGPHIAVLKTHVDAIIDFTDDVAEELMSLAKRFQFVIMEDRKFADIGNTVALQFSCVKKWAELITVHALPGPSIIDGLKKGAGSEERGAFLIAELSSKGALTGPQYAKETLIIAEENRDFVVGFVCQSRDLIKDPTFLQLTPGVQIEASGDGLGQQYFHPTAVILEKGADLAVVGRGILNAKNKSDTAEKYRILLWDAYCSRINV